MCKLFKLLQTVALLFVFMNAYPCTALIVSGKMAEDGRPLLLKHRDAIGETGRVHYYQGSKYGIMALILGEEARNNVLCGTNTAELSIINTATYNLGNRKIHGVTPSFVMYTALSSCRNLEEFESMLTSMQVADSLIPANFGLIDALGGAAFYEVSYKKWKKYDVNDISVAPDGYMVYTNFSQSGDETLKRGYARYVTSCNIIDEYLALGLRISPRWIIDNISRSLRNDLIGIDLSKDNCIPFRLFPDQDMIPNRYSSSSIVFQGSGCGKEEDTIIWTVLGFPLTTPIIPITKKDTIQSLFSGEFAHISEKLKSLAFEQSDLYKFIFSFWYYE